MNNNFFIQVAFFEAELVQNLYKCGPKDIATNTTYTNEIKMGLKVCTHFIGIKKNRFQVMLEHYLHHGLPMEIHLKYKNI